MSRALLSSVATRATGLSSTTLLHVLQLVQRSPFCDAAVGRGRESFAGVSRNAGNSRRDDGGFLSLHSNNDSAARFTTDSSGRRLYSSHAHAVSSETEYPTSSSSDYTPPPNDPNSKPPSDASVNKTPSIASYSLPKSLQLSLESGSFTSAVGFRAAFEQLSCTPAQLGYNLPKISKLFRGTATRNDWVWLGGMMSQLGAVARRAGRDDRYSWRIHALARSVLGVSLARQREWDRARSAIGWGIRLVLKDSPARYHPEPLECLRVYRDLLKVAGRSMDLVDIVRESGSELRSLLALQKETMPRYLEVCEIFNEAFVAIPEPVSWFAEELAKEEPNQHKIRFMGLALFAALVRIPSRLDDCIALHDLLMSAGISLPNESCSLWFGLLAQAGSVDRGIQTYQDMASKQDTLPHTVLTRALDMFSRAGREEEANEVWGQISTRFNVTKKDVLSFAKCFAKLGKVSGTKEILSLGHGLDIYERDIEALAVLLSAYLNANDPVGAEGCLSRMTEIQPSVAPFNRILAYYTRRVDLNSAIATFDRILQSGLSPNITSYTNLISLFANRRDALNAQNIFQAMLDAGIKPDAVAIAAILNAEIESGQWAAAANRWAKLPPQLNQHPMVMTTVLKAFVLIGASFPTVKKIFRSISNPSPQAWALVIQSACDSGNLELARDLYEEMDAANLKSPSKPAPNGYIFSILLHGYLRTNDGESARAVYEEMRSRDILPSSVTYGIIVRSFASVEGSQSLQHAESFAMSILQQYRDGLLQETPKSRGKISENLMGPLLVSAGRLRQTEDAEDYFNIAARDTEPSVPMYTKLMDAYRRVGDVDSVLSIWEKAYRYALETTTNRSAHPQAEIYVTGEPSRSQSNLLCIPLSIALDALSAVGRFIDIRKIWTDVQSAGFGFDSQNYNHYAVALARTGDVEGAFHVVENVLLPRYDEINQRRRAHMREDTELKPLPNPESFPQSGGNGDAPIDVQDLPVDPPSRPPNRRHENRDDFEPEDNTSYYNYNEQNEKPFSTNTDEIVKLLRHWRSSDITWKPALLTVAVLENAYRQIQNNSAWIGLGSADDAEGEVGEEDVEGGGTIRLPDFGGVTLKDSEGRSRRTTPAFFLARLNRKYARAVALIMLHRRKNADSVRRRGE